ncbi:precorrin-4 C(11)-methyltransferase [Rhabdothermincola sediminis]|uniref:precorrin-4 C(11)-methyltransferase n=1 Tax=Rhabdothermincola sediminis TaxID=2751370 RepID=UPI001AA03327|nr:precorrin-4 C(11)-methyltransferase [Rhabdothermincola sediminis]
MISFVGAGPGAPDLLTVRAVDRLRNADVVVWAGSLVAPEALEHCRDDAVVHDSRSMTLEEICEVFAAHPDAAIVRLHSGDPTLYGAIGEQIAWCVAHDRAFEVVPGVSSFTAAAAAAGCELTLPGVAQSVVLTRLAAGTAASVPERETVRAFATAGATMALFLSVRHVEQLVEELLADGSGYEASTPVVVASRVSRADEQLLTTSIGELAATVARAGLTDTTMILVGPALAAAGGRRSHVYDPTYGTRFRRSASRVDAARGAPVHRSPSPGPVAEGPR